MLRKTWLTLCLASIPGPVAPAGETPTRMDCAMDNRYISYSRTLDAPGKLFLLLNPDDESQLTLTADPVGLPFAGRTEIGAYRHRIDADEVESLKALLLDAVREMPGEPEPVPFGTPLLYFALGSGEALEPFASFPLTGPLPPATKRFDDRMLEVAARLIGHPTRTLRARAAWQGPYDPERGLRIRLALRNSGAVPVKIPNPAAAAEVDDVGLHVEIEEDIPPEDVTPDRRAALAVRPGEPAQFAAPGAEPGDEPQPIVTLDIGEELVLDIAIRRHLYIGPGLYRGFLTYACLHEDIDENETAGGILRVPIGPFTVPPATRARRIP